MLSKNNFAGKLKIFNVDDNDIYKVKSGYQCFVANNYGKDSKYFLLIKGQLYRYSLKNSLYKSFTVSIIFHIKY